MSLSAELLDFGAADCGGEAPASKTVTISNKGESVLRWTASIDSNVYFDLDGARSGNLEPGESTQVTVTARSLPTEVPAGKVLTATVLFTTNDTLESQVYLPVRAEARGATFELVTPELADFGQVPVGQAAPHIPVLLRNVGNAPATVTIAAPTDKQFSFEWNGDEEVELEPGESVEGLIARFTPSSIAPAASAGMLQVEGPVCGKSAAAVRVKGQGLAGTAGVSPANIDLGKTWCGTQGETRTVTIYNGGNAAYAWNASLVKGEHFTLSERQGSLAPGELAVITVVPAPIGMTENVADNGYGDELVITTDIPNQEPIEIPLKQTAYGAILKWESAESLVFQERQQLFVPSAGRKLELANDGNAPAEVRFTLPAGFAVQPATATVKGKDKLETEVAYAPSEFEAQNGALAVSTDTVLCQPLPEQVPTSGPGGKAVASAISVGGPPKKNPINERGGCAILDKSGGRVLCWGTNGHGQLGRSGATGMNIVPGLTGVTSIASGGDFNCAVDGEGLVWCWGNNRNTRGNLVGKLGVTSGNTSNTPVQVASVTDAIQVSIGHNMACALTKTGSVWCWGTNKRGQLGNGSHQNHNNAPQLLANIEGATQIVAASGGGCALLPDKTVRCWGYFTKGDAGIGSTSGTILPTAVSSLTNALAVAATNAGAKSGPRCALRDDGTVVCWGDRNYGQVGDGYGSAKSSRSTPHPVSNISNAIAIAGYQLGGCALLSDNTINCWGRNLYGQVGDGSTSVRATPVAVSGIDDATAIAAGGRAACAIVTGGSVKCWGDYGIASNTTPQTLPNF